jgi:hypothetical protein
MRRIHRRCDPTKSDSGCQKWLPWSRDRRHIVPVRQPGRSASMTTGAYSEVVKFLPRLTTVAGFEAWLDCEHSLYLK